MKKVFLDKLPHRGSLISWKKSIGYFIHFIYDDIKGDIEIVGYDKKTKFVFINYLENKNFGIYCDSLKNCNLGKIIGKKTIEFKIEIGKAIKDSKRDMIIMDRKYIKNINKKTYKYYNYHCNKCGFEDWIMESNLLVHKRGCPVCAGQKYAEEINDIPTTAPWMIPYFQGGYDEAKLYTKNSNQKIFPICPDCGRVKDKSIAISNIYINHSIGCMCGDKISRPNKIMYNILEQLNVSFEIEYSPDWIESKRYDFYIPFNQTIIEMDGGFHSNDNKMNGQTAEESKAIDDYKDKLAREHGIEVIRIDCYCKCSKSDFEYIKNNILENKRLNELFDLSKINWTEVGDFSFSNLIKYICSIKNNNTDITTTEIKEITKFSVTTIISWLKTGNKLKWCNYDAKNELIKKCKGRFKIRKVEIFKDGISLGFFNSISELERKSEELFGIKLLNSNISLVCSGKKKQYKGFTFNYI